MTTSSSAGDAGQAFRTIRRALPDGVDHVWSPRDWILVVPDTATDAQVAAAERDVTRRLLASAS